MKRFTPIFTLRHLTTLAIGLITLTVLAWPLANMWASYGQSRDENPALIKTDSQPVQVEQPRADILEKLLDAGQSPRPAGSVKTILPSQLDESANLLAPNITATKTDMIFTDVDGDGRADPGDTLKYTVTISNPGTDATGVKFTDTLDTNLTLVAGSVNTTPIAIDDPGYTVTGNVRITVSAASGVLANDIDPDTGNNTGLTASGPATTTQNGNLTLNADGSFVYNPAPGFEGTDTFTYTATDANGGTSTATVTLNVSGMFWFVNSAAGAGGDGRLTTPFNCLVGAGCYSGAANDPGDNIFLYSGNYTGGLTLKNNQRVIGQGAGASLSTITGITPPTGSDALPSTGGARPVLTTAAAATSAFTLASGNTLRGFNIGNTTAADITGTSFGTLTASEIDLTGTGRPLVLTTGTLAATFDSLTSTSSAGGAAISLSGVGGSLTVSGTTSITGSATQGISISGSTLNANFGTSTTVATSTTQGILIGTTTVGTLAFGNTTITGGTDGVSFQNNASGSRTFGTLNVSGGSGNAFLSGAGGGNVTVSGAASLSSAGNAIDVQSLTSGSAISFSGAVSATRTASGGAGVNLVNNTGSTFTFNSLAITTNAGTGLNATGGGTINVTNGTGAINSTPQAAAAIIANGVTLNANFASIAASGGTNGVSLTGVSGTSNFGSGSLTGASGSEFLVSGGSPIVTYTGSVTQNNAARVIDIQSTTGGTITFNTGTITGGASSQGVLVNAANGNVSFANLNLGTSGSRMTNQAIVLTGGSGTKSLGAISVFTNNAVGLTGSSSTGAISSASGTVDTTGAAAVNIAGVSSASRTPLNIQLQKVNSTGSATNGVIIQNTSATGSPGGFRVLGSSAGICGGSVTNTTTPGTLATVTAPNTGDCTGGTITSTSDGIRLVSVENVSLTRMFITNSSDSGIFGTEVNGFELISSYIFNNGNTSGSLGDRGLKFRDTANPGSLNGLVGSAINGSFPTRFINSTVKQSVELNVEIINRTGTLTDLLIDGCQFTDTKLHPQGLGADGFNVEMQNTSVATMRAQNSFFSNNSTQGAQVSAIDSATLNFAVTSSTFTNNNEGFVCNHSSNADLICTVGGDSSNLGNTFASNVTGASIVASSASTTTSSASQTTKIKFNNVNSPAGNVNHAVIVFVSGTNTPASIDVSNNTVINNGFGQAILVDTPDNNASPQFAVTANSNNVTGGPGTTHGVLVQARQNSTACVLIQNNTGTVQAGGAVARVRAASVAGQLATLNLKQGVSASNVAATVIQDNNPGVATSTAVTPPAVLNVVANGSCSTPAQRGEGSTPDENEAIGMAVSDASAQVQNGDQVYGFDFVNKAETKAENKVAANINPASNPASSQPTIGAVETNSSDRLLVLPLWEPQPVASIFKTTDAHTVLTAQNNRLPTSLALNHASAQEERRQATDDATQDVDHATQEDKSQSETVQVKPARRDKEGRIQSGETITVGGVSGFTLPATKTVTITFRATIGNPLPAITQVSNQGTVSGSNFSNVLTDDPSVAGTANPTVRIVDSTTIAVSSNANPSVVGQNVTFTATLTGVPVRAQTLTGTVQFKADGNNIGSPVTVTGAANSGTAQISTSSLSIGTHVITAQYSGDANFNANLGTLAGGQVVGKGNTTTGVTSSQNPSVFSQPVTFTATVVAVAPSSGTPTGTVSFLDGGNPITGCTSVALNGSGQAQCLASALAIGNHTITTTYSGDTSFNTSNGALTGNPQVVNKANSTLGLTSSSNPSVFGQPVTFTATVAAGAPATGTPTGTVSFLDGGNPIAGCTSVALQTGQAQCQPGSLSVGNHTITATYSGDVSFNTSNGSLTGNPQVVNKAGSTLGLTSSLNPSVFGQSVSFTATISATAPGAGTPTGTVQFLDGGNPIAGCTSVAVAAGQAVCSASALSVGNHTVTAAYSGDGNFNTSNGSLTGNPQVVNKANTSVGLTSSQNPSVFGQPVTFTATLSVTAPGAGTPTGSISFLDGGNPIAACTNVALSGGQAQCQPGSLSVGNHTITAAYGGDGNFNTSNGSLTGNPQVVNMASTSVAATSSLNPSVFGQSVTFTATVSVTAPGAGTPTGTFSFLDGGNPIAGCTGVAIAAGQAQCVTTALTAGNHTITAAYSGDGNFSTSTGSLTGNPQVVNKASTTTGLTSSQNPAPLGTNITFTATLAVTAPGAGTPTGTFSFLDGGNPIAGCTSVAVAAGQAQCMTTALTAGNHTITATYSGDGNFNTSNGSLTGNPQVITGPPVITPTVGLTRTQGSPASNSQIATVSDDVGAPGSIVVTAQNTPTGITVTNIVNTNGTVTANISAGCSAATGNNTIVLQATDGKTLSQTTNLVVNVAANTAPTLGNYSNTTVVLSCKAIITPTSAPADNGSVSSVMATGSAGFNGTIMVDAATGVVTISNSGPVSAGHTITVTATDNCGMTSNQQFTLTVVNPPTAPTEFDFDGDRKADVAVYRPGATVNDFSFWFIFRSSDSTVQSVQFGHDTDMIVPGDYNGDGTTDVALYRPSSNTWFTSLNPAINYGAFVWGQAGDIPVPGFYDADNKTDIAVFRPSTGQWFIAKSTGGTDVRNWGQSGDKPLPADYDGDGKTDLAVWRPSDGNWYIQKSGGGTTQQSWGVSTDLLVPADYDGDGKDDIAVFRPSTGFWYIINSSGGTRIEQWGLAGDVAAPADFDNDGKADLSVYRPSEGAWYIFNSCPCALNAKQFGIGTDKPIPTAFIPPPGP
jgi:hypothetical protein